jgi:hypothetical protein
MFSSCKSARLTILTLAVSMVSAYGAVITATGFETTDTPSYSAGAVGGQNGWSIFNSSASFDNVETATVSTGLQAVEVGAFPTSTVQTGMYHTDTAIGNLIDLNADVYVFSSSAENEWQFAGTGGTSTLTPFIGGFDLFPTAGPSDTIEAITSGFPVIGSFSLNTWHNVDFLFNFSAQTFTVTLDGTQLASGLAFCGDNGPCTGSPVAEGTFSSFFDVFATLNSNDLGAIDNFSLSSVASTVPEPASYLLLVSGLALLGAKRRFAR